MTVGSARDGWSGAVPENRPRLVADNRGLLGHGLGKSFKRRPVLRNVNVSVQRGEVVGLLGPNGAGKTTCFYIVTGLIAADTGVVTLDGRDITDLPMYRRARLGSGYLPQEASIFRGLTVEQNEMRLGRERSGDLAPSALATRQRHCRRAPEMGDRELGH